MFIIFDLDDTLIDTSGCILPYKFALIAKEVCSKTNYDDVLLRMQELNQSAQSSSEVLEKVQREFCLSDQLYLKAKKILDSTQLPKQITLLPSAKTLLESLKNDFKLFVVTFGNKQLQEMKLKNTGIDRGYFCKIVVTDQRVKKRSYQRLFEEYQLNPKDGIVIGDRALGDLKPAKELGCYTVHIKWGRGLNQEFDKSIMDRQVLHLENFYQICRNKIGKI